MVLQALLKDLFSIVHIIYLFITKFLNEKKVRKKNQYIYYTTIQNIVEIGKKNAPGEDRTHDLRVT